ncbi:MAG: class I SAM-dependent methyltransferase, partial [Leucothrix sp.]
MQLSLEVAVSGHPQCPLTQLKQLANSLGLPLIDDAEGAHYLLYQNVNRLELLNTNEPKTKAICVDFAAGKAQHRRLYGGGKGQDFSKALGLHKFPEATIIDATAGMGSDAFVMATLGCQVTLLERNPIIQQLLSDGLARADDSDDSEVQAIATRMRLVQQESQKYLESLETDEYPQLIYLDP